MDQYIGKMLDNRYELLEVVGTGGMAVVYKAMCHRLNRYVAVKILKPEAAADPELRKRFRDESQAVAMLSHPNIVAVYDVSKTANLEYIVMELIDGITLKQYIRQRGGALPWTEALHFITQVMRALRHAHSRGIVHRDIKPQNIMVLRDGSCKVADFGIAHLSNSQNTLSQEALGSVHYIAPEQAKGAKVDARTDIYSAGVVLYEMLAGRLPFEGDSPVAVALQHINTKPPTLSSLNASVPLGLEQITMKAMAMKPSDRYESARAMLIDLDAFKRNPRTVFPYPIGEEITKLPNLSDEDETQVLNSRQGGKYGTPTRTRPVHKSALGYTEAEARDRRGKSNGTKSGSAAARSKKKKKDNSGRGPLIAVIIVLLLFLIGAGAFVASTLGGSGNKTAEVSIPNLVGMQYTNAVTLYGEDFDIQIASYVTDDSQEDGEILEQDPKADSIVKQEKPTITVKVNIHSGSITMPDVVNSTESEAIQALQKAGVSTSNIIKGTAVYSSEVAVGKVVYTTPASGSPITSDTQVTYYLSKGADPDLETENPQKETVRMPSLVNSTRTQALAALKELGLSAEIDEVENSADAGTVLRQSISAGTQVEVGTTVTLTVSSGPSETESPSPSESTEPSESPTPSESTEPSESPDTSDSGGDNSTTPSESVTVDKRYTISLPSSAEEVDVVVKVGDNVAYSSNGVDTSQGSITVTLSGSGSQTVYVYIDGSLASSESVSFS